MVEPIPDEYRNVLAYIAPRDASAAIEFYQRAFGADLPEAATRVKVA